MAKENQTVLTAKQQVWLKHIEMARSRNQSLSQYAKENKLHLKALYNSHWLLKNKGVLDTPATQAFVRVNPRRTMETATEIRVQIQFSNQTYVTAEILSPEALHQVLTVIKSL